MVFQSGLKVETAMIPFTLKRSDKGLYNTNVYTGPTTSDACDSGSALLFVLVGKTENNIII